MNDVIQCPVCPLCGSDPHFALPSLTPWFCPNEDCEALAWDPYSSLSENLMDAQPVRIIDREVPD